MTDENQGPSEPASTSAAPPPTFADQMLAQTRASDRGPGFPTDSPYRSAGTRAKALRWLLGLSLVVSLCAAAINMWGWLVIDAYASGQAAVTDLEAFDIAFAAFGILETTLFIATALAWLAWQSRTIDNETPLGIGPSPWTPRTSIVWWFVPFANLVQPYRFHRDIWTRYVGTAGVGLVLWWWIAYVGSSLITNGAGRVWLVAETLEAIQSGLVIWLVADVTSAVAVLPAIALVTRIQSHADARAATPVGPPDTIASPTVAAS